jgi:hypothetical protein
MKFGRIIVCLILAGVVLVAGFALGLRFASIRGSHSEMLAEFKIDYANLEQAGLTPQLREYLKSRLYFLASELEPRDLQGFHFDFGAVDESLLGGATGIKGPESNADVYDFAMTKHSQKGSRR